MGGTRDPFRGPRPGGGPSPSELLGLYGIAGGEQWRDYTYTVQVIPGDDDYIGVVFRFTDIGEHYRFYLSEQHSFYYLLSRHNGAFHVLAFGPASYDLNTPFELSVTVSGSEIFVRRDGVLISAVEDDDHPRGAAGVFMAWQTASKFDDVSVVPTDNAGVLCSPEAP